MVQSSLLQDLLSNFISSNPDVQGSALVSPNGLPIISVWSAEIDEERTATMSVAMSVAMLSLGKKMGQEVALGVTERLFVEGDKGYSILVRCGTEAVLLILASKAAKQGFLFLSIKRLVNQIKPLLDG